MADQPNAGDSPAQQPDFLEHIKAFAAEAQANLDAMAHDELQALQWRLDEGIQILHAAKQRVHDARETQDLANRPPAASNPQVVGFGKGPLPAALAGGGK